MTNFLIKLFVKNNKNTTDPAVRERYGVFSSITGIVVNVLLAAMKLLIGFIAGSIAIIADAVNNFSDAGSGIVSFISFKIASKPADREHPYGHARIEYVCSLIVSFLIFYVGIELLIESIKGLINKQEVANGFGLLTYIVLLSCILIKLWLYFFYTKISKTINSSVIKATAMDSLSDCISTFAVLVSSLIMAYTDLWFVDSAVGTCVAFMICYAGIKILMETNNSILGEAPTEEIVEKIKTKVSEFPVVIGIHDMMVHNYGPNHYIASFHAEVDGKDDIYMLHDIIDNIERQINEEMGILCTIHLDPVVTDDEEVNRLKQIAIDALLTVCSEASIHDFRIVIGDTHTNMIFDIVLPFEVKEKPEYIVEKIKEEIKKVDPNYYCVITVDRG